MEPTHPSPAASQLANAVAMTSWRTLPRAVRVKALELVLDALAVMAGGAAHDTMRALRGAISPPDGPATVLGTGRGAPVRDAVLLNAATITVLQRQDGYALAKGHPASQLLPPLLAVAEDRNVKGEQLLTAFVAGYEVAARVGLALGGVPDHLHDIGNWVTIGVSAATASMLKPGDASAVAAAIDGASSLALSFDRFTTAAGATMHHLYPAMATVTALSVAEGASAGLGALSGSLERFYGPHLGLSFQAAMLTDGIRKDGTWAHHEVLNGYIKLHPSCAHFHGVNDAIAELIKETDLQEAQVERIDIDVFEDAYLIESSDPRNDLAARFSARATVAAAIRHRSLSDDGLKDLEDLRPLISRIWIRHDQSLDRHTPEGRPGRVTVEMRDGRSFTKEVIHPRGTPQCAASHDERMAKARTLLHRIYTEEATDQVLSAVQNLVHAKSLDDIKAALRRQ